MVNKFKHSIKHYKRPRVISSDVHYWVRFFSDESHRLDSRIFSSLYEAECFLAFARKNFDPNSYIVQTISNLLDY